MDDRRLDEFSGVRRGEEFDTSRLEAQYAAVFSVDGGDEVLRDILDLCDWPTPMVRSSPEAIMAKQSIAVAILSRLGVINEEKTALVKGLLDIGLGR